MTDLFDFPAPAVAVDLVMLCIRDGALRCVVTRREDGAQMGGDWALPGGFVHRDGSLDETVARVMAEKVGPVDAHFEQLATYGDPGRDPRGHVISVVYLAVAEVAALEAAVAANDELRLARVVVDWPGETGGVARCLNETGREMPLAFDHTAILGDMVKRLRGKLDYTPIGFEFLPPRFTLRDAQEVHEAILDQSLTKPAFRRKLLDRHRLCPTGERESGGAYRPAELYELSQDQEE